MENVNYSSEKKRLRGIYSRLLRSKSPREWQTRNGPLLENLVEMTARLKDGDMVLLYAALPSEANVWPIIQLESRLRYALPRVVPGTTKLECRSFNAIEGDLAIGSFGVREPIPEKCPLVTLASFKAIFVPGLAFTRSGGRLGKGGGFYDRLLGDPECQAWKIGVAMDWQICQDIPMEDHDQSVDVVVTESGCWN